MNSNEQCWAVKGMNSILAGPLNLLGLKAILACYCVRPSSFLSELELALWWPSKEMDADEDFAGGDGGQQRRMVR